MKVFVAALLGIFGIFMVLARKRDCTVDESLCRIGECCVLNFHGVGKICKKPGQEIGDYCGGDYFCAACDMGLTCTSFPVDNLVTRPANGTCQLPVQEVVPTIDDVRSMIAEEIQKALVGTCPVPPARTP